MHACILYVLSARLTRVFPNEKGIGNQSSDLLELDNFVTAFSEMLITFKKMKSARHSFAWPNKMLTVKQWYVKK